MEASYHYTCPLCSQNCSVERSLTGQNVVCPHCSQEFFATVPDENTEVIAPEKLPFFKSGRKKLLQQQLQELVADGEMSEQDERALNKAAILLGLKESDLNELTKEAFFKEFNLIQRRIEKAFQLSDQDLEEIETLKRKYGIKRLTLEGTADMFRRIYLIETKGEMPSEINSGLMLDTNEVVYYGVGSTWQQSRVRSNGYVGSSVSIASGIRGVRFRFGHYTPMRSEELTPLAAGTLWVTSKRLLFQGDRRNTKVEHKKVVDTEIFLDALKIEKATGKPDYFLMSPEKARYITALIGALKA